jgi:maltooligosyltrehalose trehalohydrolase
VREGRKREFEAFHLAGEPPDPESPKTFADCKLNWEKRKEGKHKVIWSLYQHLIELRRTIPALAKRDRQNIEVGFQEAEKIVWWCRWCENDRILCLMNFNQSDTVFEPKLMINGWRKILDSADEKWQGVGSLSPQEISSGEKLTLRSQSFALYENS